MSYSVEYFVRKFGFYFYYTWNSDSEQRQKKDADLIYYQNTLISFTYLSDLSLLISHQME